MWRQALISALAGVSFLGFASQSRASAETRDFVVSWWMQAANSYKDDSDCVGGPNALPEEMARQQLLALGNPKEVVEEMIGNLVGGSANPELQDALIYRGRHNGKPVHSYTYPTTVPDVPGLAHRNIGPLAYGFDLDSDPKTGEFTDPDTKQKGIDNAFWRAAGCWINHRGTREQPPTHGSLHWDIQRDKQPAWVIRITADDFKSGPVTVNMYRAMERIWRDANGDVRRYSTFRVDPDVRWQNTFKGTIKDGVINVTAPQLHLLGDPYVLVDLDMSKAQFRIVLDKKGNLEGVLGGYVPWRTVFYEYGSSGFQSEFMIGVNLPAMYYALRKNADAYPDPKTGENTAISTAYRVAAVPAFLLTKEQNAAAAK